MSAMGGVIGLITGATVAWCSSMFIGFTAVVEIESVLLSLSFAIAVGVFFGFYPARRAADLDPIEALSYE